MKKEYAIVLIIFLGLLLRLAFLNQSFWLDETAQAVISAKPLSEINWAADFQPPLFYVLTHVWQSFGVREEWFLRLLPVFFGIATIYLVYRFFTKLFTERVGLISALLLATAPFHIYYSQEYRMYSFFAFLVIASWMFLWEKKWFSYTIITIALLYTHYFAFLLFVSQLIFIFLTKKEMARPFLYSLIVSLLCFAPWLPTLQKQVQTAGNLISVWPRWKEVSGVPFLKFPFLLLAKFTVGMTSPQRLIYGAAVIMMGAVFLAALLKIFTEARKKTSSPNYYLLLCYFSIPVILACISGLWISANGPWRLLFVLPAFYGIIASVIARNEVTKQSQPIVVPAKAGIYLNRFRVKPGMTIVSILLVSNLVFSFYYLFFPKNHRENWKEAIWYTDNKVGERGAVLSEYIGPWSPMVWYSKKPEKYIGASTSLPITQQTIQSQLDPILGTHNSVLLYTYLFPLSDPSQQVELYLKNRGYKIVEEKDFKGVGIVKIFRN